MDAIVRPYCRVVVIVAFTIPRVMRLQLMITDSLERSLL